MNVGIIGAGVAGLSAALDLAKAGHQVTIFEASDRPGGLASGFKDPRWDWELERFYHHWFVSDTDIIQLIEEIGQRDKLFFPTPITSLYVEGNTYEVTPPIPKMLLFPKLPPIPKIRFGLASVYLRLTKNWQDLEKETAHNWLIKTIGEKAYQIFWEPLLIGKFGEHYKEVNMAWLWARVHKRSVKLGYFKGGFQAFNEALCHYVQNKGVDIKFNTSVQKIISLAPQNLEITTATGVERFEQVIVTTSPGLLARLTPDLPANYLQKLKNLRSMGALVVVLALNQPLTKNHYWINLPKTEDFPFLALVEHTNFVDAKYYGQDHIIYCGDYLEADHPYFEMSKEELLTLFLPTLAKFNPDFRPEWVRESWLFKEKYAQPIPPINHSRNIPPLKTPVVGLYWASMSQVYPWDRGTNYAVEIGRRVAKEVMQG